MKTVVITPCGNPHTVRTHVGLIQATTDADTEIVVAAYGLLADEVVDAVRTLGITSVNQAPEPYANPIEAINAAAKSEATNIGPLLEGQYAILAEDTQLFPGWLDAMAAGLSAPRVLFAGDDEPRKHFQKIGIVGPVSPTAATESQLLKLEDAEDEMAVAEYAAARIAHFDGMYSQAEVLDWRCMVFSGSAFRSYAQTRLLNPDAGDFINADFAVRCARDKVVMAVAEQVVVPFRGAVSGKMQTPTVRQVNDRIVHYGTWMADSDPKLVAISVVRLQEMVDLANLRTWAASAGQYADKVAVILGNNPLDLQGALGFDLGKLSPGDRALLDSSSGADEQGVLAAFKGWLEKSLRNDGVEVYVEVWPSAPDRRSEVNYAIQLAESNCDEGDWILHIDQDEVLEVRVDRGLIQRLMSHPNPLVSAWDFAQLHHWGTSRLVREDPPYGDGGTFTGGPSEVRMWRSSGRRVRHTGSGGSIPMAPAYGAECVRVAGVRVRSFSMMTEFDRNRRHASRATSEGMRFTEFNRRNGIGLHMLFYPRESAEDIARWLDDVHGLIDDSVFVWTDDDFEVTAEFSNVLAMFDSNIEHCPLNDNIAAARNAGIDALRANERLGWALFFDPDEWLGDRNAQCKMLRRMADSPSRLGWLLRFENTRADGGVATISDSCRMSRLDEVMRMDGRVHEGFGEAIKAVQARGEHPGFLFAPFVVKHRGMAFDSARMGEKLANYERLLRLELADNPHSPGAWVSLGWNYANDGHLSHAVECYTRGIQCAGQSYLPFKELAFFHLREARALVDLCIERLVPTHPFAPAAGEMQRFLHAFAAPHPVIDSDSDSSPVPLPDFPASPDRVG